jgi:16S rRNA (cytidine1402-2'-O)-methyltransferase
MKKLILLPNLLDSTLKTDDFLPANLKEKIKTLNGLIAESEKSARAYLRRFLSHEEVNSFKVVLLNEHTQTINDFINLPEETWGIISDAGLPCLADPGSNLVELCYKHNIQVEAVSGPSSLFLALMLSGFSGQHFCFHGYLPREDYELEQKIRLLEKSFGTQIFIEAPYRNEKLLQKLLAALKKDTRLCVAIDLTLPSQMVISKKVSEWKMLSFNKRPAVFLISAK